MSEKISLILGTLDLQAGGSEDSQLFASDRVRMVPGKGFPMPNQHSWPSRG